MLCQKANQQFNWHGDFVYDDNVKKGFDEFLFDVSSVEEKYYLSEKVKKYVLAGGTKNFKTGIKTDLDVARPLLTTMHKMHRAGVDNYVTHHKGKIRKLSMTVALVDGSEYEGGDFEINMSTPEKEIIHVINQAKIKGSVTIFPSFVWHRVKPVTSGTRYSLVVWNLGKPFK